MITPPKTVIEKVAFYDPKLAKKYIEDVDEEFGDNLHPILKGEVFRVMQSKELSLKVAKAHIQDATFN